MHVIKLFISILTDFVTSHKIVFYSKLYDIAFLKISHMIERISHYMCNELGGGQCRLDSGTTGVGRSGLHKK